MNMSITKRQAKELTLLVTLKENKDYCSFSIYQYGRIQRSNHNNFVTEMFSYILKLNKRVLFVFHIFLLCGLWACHGILVEVRGQLVGVKFFFFLPCRFWLSNLGHHGGGGRQWWLLKIKVSSSRTRCSKRYISTTPILGERKQRNKKAP